MEEQLTVEQFKKQIADIRAKVRTVIVGIKRRKYTEDEVLTGKATTSIKARKEWDTLYASLSGSGLSAQALGALSAGFEDGMVKITRKPRSAEQKAELKAQKAYALQYPEQKGAQTIAGYRELKKAGKLHPAKTAQATAKK
jgi:hypothetical protein